MSLGALNTLSSRDRTQTKIKMEFSKFLAFLAAGLLLMAPVTFAAPASEKDKDEVNRLVNAGTVIEEILNVPDDIPQNLLDKARCVVVMPSVLKAAFVVGGSYGRGTMVCRTGEH